MRTFLRSVAIGLLHLGGFGLLLFGILDSSFIALPLGNDLLVIALSARYHARMLYYAAMATAGSVIGCVLLVTITQRGHRRLQRRMPEKRLERMEYIERQVYRHAGWAVGIAALMPPPFPFTPVVAAAAIFDYPRKKLLSIIAAMRFLRFSLEGALAVRYGRHIVRLTRTRDFEWIITGFIVLASIATVFSLYRWIRQSREPADVSV